MSTSSAARIQSAASNWLAKSSLRLENLQPPQFRQAIADVSRELSMMSLRRTKSAVDQIVLPQRGDVVQLFVTDQVDKAAEVLRDRSCSRMFHVGGDRAGLPARAAAAGSRCWRSLRSARRARAQGRGRSEGV